MKEKLALGLQGLCWLAAWVWLIFSPVGAAAEVATAYRFGGPVQADPLAYVDPHGVYTGYSVDLARNIGALENERVVLFYPDTWPENLSKLLEGQLEAVHSVLASPQLPAQVQFIPYLETASVIFVLSGRQDIEGFNDLKDKRVACVGTGAAWGRLRRNSRIRVLAGNGLDQAFRSLASNQVDAVVAERFMARRYAAASGLYGGVKIVGREVAREQYGFILLRDRPQLAREFRRALAMLSKQGKQRRLRNQWFGEILPQRLGGFPMTLRWSLVFIGGSLLLTMVVMGWNLLLQRELELKNMANQKNQLDRTVAAEKRRFEAVVSSMTAGLMLVNPEGGIVYINRQGAEHLGLRPEALLDRPLMILKRRLQEASADPERLLRHWEAAETHPHRASVFEFLQTTTHAMHLRMKWFPVWDGLGHFSGQGILIEDITHERKVEKMKSEFVSVASHELRTPMTSILGFSELMLTKTLASDLSRHYLEQIHHEAERLTRILNDMLDMSYLESGQVVLKKQALDVNELIRQVSSSFQNQVRQQRELELFLDPTAGKILGDRDKLTQVLWNLLSNADKYSPPEKTVTISSRGFQTRSLAWPFSEEELATLLPAVEIQVSDRGQGIPADQLAMIFLPFHRVETAVHTIRGTGLGLAIVKRIVDAHGGKVWAESLPGKPTLFSVLLPTCPAGRQTGGGDA